jgi:cysteine-S-conjugate beta-lyase
MKYNFDVTPNRRRSNSHKWTKYPADTLPFWVADMDFPAPQPILAEVRKFAEHGVLGYELPKDALKETVAARMENLYNWKVNPSAVTAVTGTVSGFNVAARAFCSPRKGILIQTPVYNEFHEVKDSLGIPQLNAPLVERVDGNILSYEIDWDIFKKQAKKAGMFLLCNPHNPLGINFSREDLIRMAEICIENNVIIVSDEIHSELLLDGNQFTPLAKLSPEIAKHTVTLVSPSKAFNVAGLFCGFAITSNRELHERYQKEVEHLHLHVSSIGLRVAQVAFSGKCDGWLRSLQQYLTENRDFLVDYVTENMPGVHITVPDATYLSWLDFTQLKLKKSPFEFFMKEAKVALSDGKIFGEDYKEYVRLNFGTSRKILKQGLDRIRKVLK